MKMDFSDIFLSKGVNYFSDDLPLISALKYFDIPLNKSLDELGRFVSDELIEVSMLVDHYSKPVLQTWSITDKRIDSVWISPEHFRMLQKMQELGVVKSTVEPGSMIYHFLSGYIISDPGFYCTLTLTAQTAYALQKYADTDTKDKFLAKYLDPVDPWYGATYYTEIQGGSDLGSNRASASFRDGKWVISTDDKYFASNAGLADGAIVTARTERSDPGVKGLSIFFIPARNSRKELNYNVRRLKDKLGTISVPTGEVELHSAEAYLLGDQRYGIYYALEILMVSRIDDAISAVGIARKALWESYRYACSREAFGRRIIDQPLMLRDFLQMETELEGSMILAVLASSMFSMVSSQVPPYDDSYHITRAFSHIAKNNASWVSDSITRYCMEIFGGKGFLREFPIEKFHRDSIVTSIWEGTTNIQALDLVELLVKRNTHVAIRVILLKLAEDIKDKGDRNKVIDALMRSFTSVEKWLSSRNPEIHAKEILDELAHDISMAYLFNIAEKDNDGRFRQIASIFYFLHFDKQADIDELFLKPAAISWMGRD